MLESGANMAEMLLVPFTAADRTSGGALVFGGPFLILFIGANAVMFVGVSLVWDFFKYASLSCDVYYEHGKEIELRGGIRPLWRRRRIELSNPAATQGWACLSVRK